MHDGPKRCASLFRFTPVPSYSASYKYQATQMTPAHKHKAHKSKRNNGLVGIVSVPGSVRVKAAPAVSDQSASKRHQPSPGQRPCATAASLESLANYRLLASLTDLAERTRLVKARTSRRAH